MKKFFTSAFTLLMLISIMHIPAHAFTTTPEAIYNSIKGLGTSH